MLPTEGFVDPLIAWSLVVTTVALGAGLLGYLHEITHLRVRAQPEGDEPTRWRDAA
jgi:hypothetical protein